MLGTWCNRGCGVLWRHQRQSGAAYRQSRMQAEMRALFEGQGAQGRELHRALPVGLWALCVFVRAEEVFIAAQANA
jgi:hypothetical protein